MKETPRQQVGRKGEEEVCTFLIKEGHTILKRNWRSSHREVDIISMSKDGLHFVEVKTRVEPLMAEPERNVDRRKQQRLAAAARAFLGSGECDGVARDVELFFDVASVVYGEGKVVIEYYPQAFIPIYA